MATPPQQSENIWDTFGKQFAILTVAYASCSYLAGAATKDYYVAGWQEVLPWALGLSAVLAAFIALLLTHHAIETALNTDVFTHVQSAASGAVWDMRRIIIFIVFLIVLPALAFWSALPNGFLASILPLWLGFVCVPIALWAVGAKLYALITKTQATRVILYGLAICAVLSLVAAPLVDQSSRLQNNNERRQLCIATISNPSADPELKDECTLLIDAATRNALNKA